MCSSIPSPKFFLSLFRSQIPVHKRHANFHVAFQFLSSSSLVFFTFLSVNSSFSDLGRSPFFLPILKWWPFPCPGPKRPQPPSLAWGWRRRIRVSFSCRMRVPAHLSLLGFFRSAKYMASLQDLSLFDLLLLLAPLICVFVYFLKWVLIFIILSIWFCWFAGLAFEYGKKRILCMEYE